MAKVVVSYNHDPADLSPIYVAVVDGQPASTDWLPALRDVVDGKYVVWVRNENTSGDVWLRDRQGERLVRSAKGRVRK